MHPFIIINTQAATYLLGFMLGTERLTWRLHCWLQLLGVLLAVGGAVVVTVKPEAGGAAAAKGDLAKASVFLGLQVMLGGAGFWHLQKKLLDKGYSNIQVVAWYYSYGVVLLALVVLPNAMDASMWHFHAADWKAMGFGLALWSVYIPLSLSLPPSLRYWLHSSIYRASRVLAHTSRWVCVHRHSVTPPPPSSSLTYYRPALATVTTGRWVHSCWHMPTTTPVLLQSWPSHHCRS
jgi:hypothetical protein